MQFHPTKTYNGDNEDGTPNFTFDFDDPANPMPATHHIFWTGPISTTLRMDDGTPYNVTDKFIGIHVDHDAELKAKIRAFHVEHGTFEGLVPSDEFVVQVGDAPAEAAPVPEA
jgi:hypothetical protein